MIPEGATRHALFNGNVRYFRRGNTTPYEQYVDGVWMGVCDIERSSSPIDQPPYDGPVIKQHISGYIYKQKSNYKGD